MSPETRESMMLCAQACEDADASRIARQLQYAADIADATDADALYWLQMAGFACEAIACERAARGDSSKSVEAANRLCSEAHTATCRRMALGVSRAA